ncbi:integral membrane sensor hybrid histidine kinase [Rhizorhabdus wittichii RW1]|uniref:histidine kinase n=1 Tax=Rhizorhabdus wittichii (strain DSM 6014 / CCUG 31198 / JCM 15750 / NBRC 105917 / EY 4224 / RW1) TaxID=392499 RepID=A0A9J9HEN2_RHIWR|nr:integral membrane sensor hybrid histidine kinase [Rhizorhabdus wittichii RW1]
MATFSPDALKRGLSPATQRALAAAVLALTALGLLVAVVMMVAQSNAARDDALRREQHSYDIMVLTRSLDASLARSEAALGRYVVNGDRKVGTIYYDEWRRAMSQLRQLDRLVGEQPDQVKLVRKLEGLASQRDKELTDAASFANVGKGWYAIGMFNKAGESPNVVAISATLEQIAANERTRLGVRSEATFFSAERANGFATLLSVLGLVLMGLAILLGWLVAAAAAQRAHAAEQAEAEADRASQLEAAVAERTRELREANDRLREESETRVRAEAQLAQAQKMEAVGQLTGGIAHDFNNMLAVVVGGLDLARRKIAQRPAEAGVHLDGAMEGADRAAALTRRLLSFARAEPLLPDAVLPAKLVAGMNVLLDRTLGERVTVQVDTAGAHWPIWADAHQLENAILNLAVNARDAMEGAGRLDISVADVAVAAGDSADVKPGDYVRISVADTGCGMSPQVLARAFEPFFTTKPVGKGTGLGLSQIFGFVRQSHGDVRVDSEVGKGTTISLYLPRYHGVAAERNADAADRAARPKVGSLSILLVEDDPRVQASTRAGLTELGHIVRACASGEEALAMLAEDGGVDLVLTDVMMPGMTGPELIAAISRDYPEIAALFVTGYVGEAGQSDDFAGYEVLRKPFTIAALGNAVARAIDRRGKPPTSQAA